MNFLLSASGNDFVCSMRNLQHVSCPWVGQESDTIPQKIFSQACRLLRHFKQLCTFNFTQGVFVALLATWTFPAPVSSLSSLETEIWTWLGPFSSFPSSPPTSTLTSTCAGAAPVSAPPTARTPLFSSSLSLSPFLAPASPDPPCTSQSSPGRAHFAPTSARSSSSSCGVKFGRSLSALRIRPAHTRKSPPVG
jgi:hypothetical protein